MFCQFDGVSPLLMSCGVSPLCQFDGVSPLLMSCGLGSLFFAMSGLPLVRDIMCNEASAKLRGMPEDCGTVVPIFVEEGRLSCARRYRVLCAGRRLRGQ